MADIIGFNERRAKLVAPHLPLVSAGIDQLSLAHQEGHSPTVHVVVES
jgi:hypothetical protein